MTAESRPALVLDACVMMSGLLRPLLLDLGAVFESGTYGGLVALAA